jgi:hypothetical protein
MIGFVGGGDYFVVTRDFSVASNPVVTITWPSTGAAIADSSVTVRGLVDDPTVTVTATVTDAGGNATVVAGSMERDGHLWAENLPLAEGANQIALSVTNAAGMGITTNITVTKTDMALALTGIDGDLWQPTVNVSGVISDLSAPVWVNGVQGVNNGDGTWNANAVPVSAGGVASFAMSAALAGASVSSH